MPDQAKPAPSFSVEECFCQSAWRDLNVGHFDLSSGKLMFIIDRPVTAGPDGLRAAGDALDLGLSGTFSTGLHLAMDDGSGQWCALQLGTNDVAAVGDQTFFQMGCTEAMFGCSTALTLDQVATLYASYDTNANCSAEVAALDLPDPPTFGGTDEGCAVGVGPWWMLALVVGWRVRRRERAR